MFTSSAKGHYCLKHRFISTSTVQFGASVLGLNQKFEFWQSEMVSWKRPF